MLKNIGVVGAGFSGAVIAHELAKAGYKVTVLDSRSHLAGNCHSQRDSASNIMTHVYGPHIFHTSNERVWNYIQQFDEFMPFINRVKAIYNGRIYSLPINLMTINSFFGKTFSPKQAVDFMEMLGDKSIDEPQSFEQQALRFIGKDLYEAFFKGYTLKQWGIHPAELPASILKRLPVRFNYDDNYYTSTYQGIPKHGYTHIVEKMLDHPNITVHLNTKFERNMAKEYHHVFYSGSIDAWFGFSEGRLCYRTLDFLKEYHSGDYQGNAVINYCDQDVPWTRISEHKHFAPWESHPDTLIYKEFSRVCGETDIPYYPVRLVNDKAKLTHYVELAKAEKNITFVGRLGTYRYLDMHVTIAEALDAVARYFEVGASGAIMPNFVVDPLS
ncbi:UDP-galactopyranose mutase [Methylomonas paludis]|uniref:UDP-galactopyranose mutase n=1 Tax=Methylomonas paludis TaxID=1173101 RepID=A0A975R8X6_9GAMM|nr:UDP-galactopyranose mutase [Methylomonas paludis]QWF70865.1 UDP-galactopyranose mutase [Methylomonas paludis]